MRKSFVTFFRMIFTQNSNLDPEIDSTPRAQQNAHLIDQKRPQKYQQKLFLKNLVEIEYLLFWSDFRDIYGHYLSLHLKREYDMLKLVNRISLQATCGLYELDQIYRIMFPVTW